MGKQSNSNEKMSCQELILVGIAAICAIAMAWYGYKDAKEFNESIRRQREAVLSSSEEYTKSEFRYMSQADQKLMKSIIASEITPDMNRVEQIKAIHDWMVVNLQYDVTHEQHNASDTLNNKIAVCSGYSALFSNFMDMLGIPNQNISGEATSNKGVTGRHSWNAVQLEDGNYYYVDVTWDDPVRNGTSDLGSSNLKYEYFLVSLPTISINHMADTAVPSSATENCDWESFLSDKSQKASFISIETQTSAYQRGGVSMGEDEEVLVIIQH